jgi:hypothetical protein
MKKYGWIEAWISSTCIISQWKTPTHFSAVLLAGGGGVKRRDMTTTDS